LPRKKARRGKATSEPRKLQKTIRKGCCRITEG
jgi:hypothetical protein